jgi:hypothetical protein
MTNIIETLKQTLQGIATGAPLWVWPLLAGLILLGMRARKTRSGPVWPYYLIPFIGVMTLKDVAELAHPALAWGSFATSYCGSAFAAYRFQNTRMLKRENRRVTVQGEWVTLLTLMIIFWANFVRGTVQTLAPHIDGSHAFVAGFAVILGGCSGCFFGRSVSIATWRATPD